MYDRAYILLDITDGKAEQVAQALKGISGVIMADMLEGPPDVIVVMEAPDRQLLAKQVMQVLAFVETETESICLLPTSQITSTTFSSKLSRQRKGSNKNSSSKRLLSL